MSLLTLSTCYFSCLTFILLCWNSSVYVNAKISISALPPPSNDTVEVEIYSYIYFIGQIEPVRFSEWLDIEVFMKWKDCRVADGDGIDLTSIWHASIYEENEISEQWKLLYQAVWARSGTIYVRRHVQAPFRTFMQFKKFWNDEHRMKARFRSAVYFKDEVKLVKSPSLLLCGGFNYTSLSDYWPSADYNDCDHHPDLYEHAFTQQLEVQGVQAYTLAEYFPPDDGYYSTFVVEVHIRRDIEFLFIAIFIPLVLLLLILVLNFFIEPRHIQRRIKLHFKVLFSASTFNNVIYQYVPRVSYVVNFNAFVIWTYAMIMLSFIETLIAYEIMNAYAWRPLKEHLKTPLIWILPKRSKLLRRIENANYEALEEESDDEGDGILERRELEEEIERSKARQDAIAQGLEYIEDESKSSDELALEEVKAKWERVSKGLDGAFRFVYPLMVALGPLIFLVDY